MTSHDNPQPERPQGGNTRRRWIITGSCLLGLSLIFLLVWFVLPTPTARYIIESQLDGLGVLHDGVDSVTIDLWNSEVSAGPLTFRSGDASEGQLGEAGFRYNFANLFKKRALIEVFFLSGINLAVKRYEDGKLTLNGIDLATFSASDHPAEAQGSEPADQESSGFGVGIDSLEFTDSRLIFEDFTGGSVAMDLKRLTLTDFRSWEPDTPGKLEMESMVNDMSVNWEGTATPFADTLKLTLRTTLREGTIDKIARFTGPTGLARQDGQFESDVIYDFALHADGRVSGTIDGEFRLHDVDIETEEGASIAFDKGRIGLDLVKEIHPDGAKSLGGTIDVETDAVAVKGHTGINITLNDLAFHLRELDFLQLAERRAGALDTDAAAEPSADAGRTRTIVELALAEVKAFTRRALRHELEIDGSPSISAASGTFILPSGDGGADREVRFSDFSAQAPGVDSQTVSDGWTVTAAIKASLEQAWTGAAGQDQNAGLTATGGELTAGTIAVETVGDETSITFDVTSALDKVALVDPAGVALTLQSISADTPGMTVAGQDDEGHIRGPVQLGIESLEAGVPSETGDLDLTGQAIRFDTPDFNISGGEALSLTLTGALDISDVLLAKRGADRLDLALDGSRIDLTALKIDPLGSGAAVDASFVTELTALQVSLGDDDAARQLTLEDTKVDLERLTVATSEPLSLDLSGSALMRAITAALPMANGETLNSQVDRVTVGELEFASKDEAFKSAANIAIEGIEIRTDGELPQSIDVSGVIVDGLKVDPAQGFEIASIAIDQLNAEITDSILALDGGEKAEGDGAVAGPTASPSTPFRLDQVSVTSGSVIKVTDASVEPPMKLEIVIENAKVGPIDTSAPDTQTEIDLGTAINKDATIKVLGWASPLLPTPAFDLSADVSKLPLPPLSPYVGSAVGLNIDSGTLNAVAKANASGDALKGQIDVLIDDLFLEPVSDEIDKEIESSYGVSANFATGILKDDKGRIDLGFPVSGSVKEPKIDYSEAISKAIGGALASLFPLNWFGDDGSSFKILPVTFGPGSAELTSEGEAASDEVGKILVEKPQLNIRVCGKATAGDLIVLRGGEVPASTPMHDEGDELPDADAADGGESDGTSNVPTAEQPTQALAKPSQQEVDQLLELAIQRGQVVRQYLTSTHGVIADHMSECRTSYSIEDGKSPRAEFRF